MVSFSSYCSRNKIRPSPSPTILFIFPHWIASKRFELERGNFVWCFVMIVSIGVSSTIKIDPFNPPTPFPSAKPTRRLTWWHLVACSQIKRGFPSGTEFLDFYLDTHYPTSFRTFFTSERGSNLTFTLWRSSASSRQGIRRTRKSSRTNSLLDTITSFGEHGPNKLKFSLLTALPLASVVTVRWANHTMLFYEIIKIYLSVILGLMMTVIELHFANIQS